MKLFILLLSLFLYLQWKLWIGEGNFFEVQRLHQKVEAQKNENQSLRIRNLQLIAQVESLKSGTEAIEEYARSELGMIRKGETFYQIVSPPLKNGDQIVSPPLKKGG